MIAITLVSFLATGIFAYSNFKSKNEEYHSKRLQRKEKAIQTSMDYFLKQKAFDVNSDTISALFSDKICELAHVHSLDLNLFDLDGKLILSSDPKIFEEKNIPDDVSPLILQKLVNGNERIIEEKAHTQTNYYLAYWHFSDLEGRPLGVTNVPYFDAKNDSREDLEEFLGDLILIYVGLFLAASLISLFLSGYIANSLHRIGEKMKEVDLAKKNLPLEWHSNDELGQLVQEYNRMLEAAEKSTTALAKSERESAWREMAKQVAHEIKNPLTPMKLRIQHLQKAHNENAKDWDQKFKTTSESLINQIDVLTNIANEFSTFAQMPKAKNELLNISTIIKDSIETFNTQGLECSITYIKNSNDGISIKADKDQMLRVFNNLIKNALQSIPTGTAGKVEIIETEYNGMIKLEIKDNGSGIPTDIQENIFVPNFTTKSKGMGLGLSMVKNIIENLGGQIWFKTSPDSGTSFFITLKGK